MLRRYTASDIMMSSFVVHSSSNRWTLQRRSRGIANFWVIYGLTLLLKRRHCPLGLLVEIMSELTHNWKLYPPAKVARDWESWSSGWKPWCEAIMVRRTLSTVSASELFDGSPDDIISMAKSMTTPRRRTLRLEEDYKLVAGRLMLCHRFGNYFAKYPHIASMQ